VVWTPVVCVEYPPGFEMCHDALDGCPQSGDLGVAFFVSFAELSAGWCFARSGLDVSLVTLIGDGAAGLLNDLFDRCLGEGEGIVGLAGKRIGEVDRCSVQQAD
jgi:hypothetical protein